MLKYARTLLWLACLAFCSCGGGTGNYATGGGGNGGGTADIEGVWYGSYTLSGQTGSKPVIAVIEQGGYAFFYDDTGAVFVLPKLTGTSTFGGTLNVYAAFGGTLPDGSTHESFALASGKESATAISANFAGNGKTGSFSLKPLATQANGVVVLNGTLPGFYLGSGGTTALSLTLQPGGVLAGTDAFGCNIAGTFGQLQSGIIQFAFHSTGTSAACGGTTAGLGFVTNQDIFNLFGGAAGNFLYVVASNSQGAFVAELKFP